MPVLAVAGVAEGEVGWEVKQPLARVENVFALIVGTGFRMSPDSPATRQSAPSAAQT